MWCHCDVETGFVNAIGINFMVKWGNLVGLLLCKWNITFRLTDRRMFCFEMTSCLMKNRILLLEIWNFPHSHQRQTQNVSARPAKWNTGNWNPFSNFTLFIMCVINKGKSHEVQTNVFSYNVCVLSFTQLLRDSALLSCHLQKANINFLFMQVNVIKYNVI